MGDFVVKKADGGFEEIYSPSQQTIDSYRSRLRARVRKLKINFIFGVYSSKRM